MSDSSSADSSTVSLLYRLNDHIPWPKAFLIALQQVLAMLVGAITPPAIVAAALGLPFEEKAYLLNMSLFASGLGTLVQVTAFRGVGTGILSITGTSFAFITPLILAGEIGGLPLIFGMALAMAPVEMLLAPFLPKLQRVVSPVVSGTVVLLIGVLLIPTAVMSVQAPLPGEHKPIVGLGLALLVIVTVVTLNAVKLRWARLSAALLALLGGYILCYVIGAVKPPPGDGGWISVPIPFKYGLDFSWVFVLPFGFLYLVTAIETIGDITACSELSGEPIEGPVYWKRIRGGVLADGLNSALAACLSCFPNTTFSQNNGVIQLTGVASRRVGFLCGGLLVLFGLVPGLGRWLASVPGPVMGGLTLVLFGLIATAGIRILMRARLDHRGLMILATALGVGIGIGVAPEVLDPLPETVRLILSSGVSTGGLVALILNLVVPRHDPLPETASSTSS
jgi:xanthine permease